ncbi:MAG: hypothetical protein GEV08_14330 [Acidimicrobiia bacterium]|nr:hypothetical protein [Acidimicrobiia bacterium]
MLITCRGALGFADLLCSTFEAAGASNAHVGRGNLDRDHVGRITQHLMATGPGELLEQAIEALARRTALEVSVSQTRGASFVTLVAEPAGHQEPAGQQLASAA